MKRILLVEDDASVRSGLKTVLEEEHYTVLVAETGERGLSHARSKNPDCIILDLMLPDKNGIEICKELRGEGNKTPILMLTSRADEIDKVSGLQTGADDYVTKPFSSRELLARIEALLRRSHGMPRDIRELAFGDVVIDFVAQEARKGKRLVKLSALEFKILKYFAEHEGEVITRNDLLDGVWGYDAMPTTRTVDNFVLLLRKHLEDSPSNPKHFLTFHRSGYKFVR